MSNVITRTPVVIENESSKVVSVPDWKTKVVSVPLNQAFPELNEVKEFRNRVCLFNEDRTRLFDVVSSRYALIEHEAAINTIGSALATYFGNAVEDPKVVSWKNGACIRAQFKLPLPMLRVAEGDITELSIEMFNSYDRSMPFSAYLSGLRLVCKNGMRMHRSFGYVSGKHIGLNRNNAILLQLDNMVKSQDGLRATWIRWMEEKVVVEELPNILGTFLPKKLTDSIIESATENTTKWELYNQLTYYSTHETKTLQRRVELDGIIANIAYNM